MSEVKEGEVTERGERGGREGRRREEGEVVRENGGREERKREGGREEREKGVNSRTESTYTDEEGTAVAES